MQNVALTADTLRLIERDFAIEARPEVARQLETRCGSSLPLMDQAGPEQLERIWFAVLKLAAGDAAALERHIAIAREDWRDTLVAAGFGHSVTEHRVWFEERMRG